MRRTARVLLVLVCVLMPAALAHAADPGHASRHALVLEVTGAIGPATADYVVRGIAGADPAAVGAIVLRLDTPGGLDGAMRDIIRAMLASPVPVLALVAPSGARAASAGTYIAYAGALAAMAPGTNLGAATPIRIGGPGLSPGGDDAAKKKDAEPDGDAETRKMVNDAVAYIRSLAELHGRNADWAEKAVRGAASLSAQQAVDLHVVDMIAGDARDLLDRADGRRATVNGRAVALATAGLPVVVLPPDWRTELLAVLTNPNVAYLLMLLAAYGLFFELANPGVVLPGLIGTIAGLLALFALDLLPVDYAGAGLVLLGIALMVAEAFIGAFGVIGVAGIGAFALGSLLMFDTRLPAFGLSPWVVGVATLVTAALFLLVVAMLVRSRRRAVVTGGEALEGARARVVDWQGGRGRVRLEGEVWQATAAVPLAPGAAVRVTGRHGLVLDVEATTEGDP